MKKVIPIAFVLVSAAAVACATPFADDGNAAAAPGTEDAGTSSPDSDAGGGDTGRWQIPTCAETSGPMHAFTSSADVEARVAGAWFRCSGGIQAEPVHVVGIEFSGPNVSFLLPEGDTLVRGGTWDYETKAKYQQIRNSLGQYEIDLSSTSPDHQSLTTFPRTSEDGRFLELSEATFSITPLKEARYVRAVAVGSATPPQPVTDSSVGGGSCTEPLDPVHAFTSTADVSARIFGRWEICSGGLPSPSDTDGIEFTETQAFFLVDSAAGLVPGPTVDHEGALSVAEDPTGSYAISVQADGATGRYFPRVSENGHKLALYDQDGHVRLVCARVA